MRSTWLITVAITALGCKDPEAKPPAQQAPAPAGSGVASAPPTPRLDPATTGSTAFDAEAEDKPWAADTETAIKAVAPELTDVECKQQLCRATLTAPTDTELVRMADKLSEESSVRGTGARSVQLTAPVTENGRRTMQIYVTYER